MSATDPYCGFATPVLSAFGNTGANDSSTATLNQFLPLLSAACPAINITTIPTLFCMGSFMVKPLLSCTVLNTLGVKNTSDPCAGLPSTGCVNLPGDSAGDTITWNKTAATTATATIPATTSKTGAAGHGLATDGIVVAGAIAVACAAANLLGWM
ncbi:hypothetical protein HDU83_008871 [Entophlyctis luteolus]|nr:hypothetical protein HDU83_008871 [Entophlyctis luteolus]